MNPHLACVSCAIPVPAIVECTGTGAGLSKKQQVRLMLLALVANNGEAPMSALYEAVNVAIAPKRLSSAGRAVLRGYINRDCIKDGLIAPNAGVTRIAAQWCITAQGRAQVEPAPRERPRAFAEPMLRALGKLSGHTLNPMDRHEAVRATLIEAGYDPDNLPLGWNTPSSNGQPLILESLRSLARSMSTLIARTKRNTWSLTSAGLERAAQYNGVTLTAPPVPPVPLVKKPGPNLTAQWFTKHLTPPKGGRDSELMRMLRGAVTKHMPLSARRGLIEDHIQNFMVKVIHRDSFAELLSDGGDVLYTKVASYCVNSSRSDARDMGTDPVCREMMGARTDKERRQPPQPEQPEVTVYQNVRDTDGNLLSPVEANDPEQDFETVWKRVEEVAMSRRPKAWKLYAPVLRLKAEGFSTQEIAAKQGINRNLVAKMIVSGRQVLRDVGVEV